MILVAIDASQFTTLLKFSKLIVIEAENDMRCTFCWWIVKDLFGD